MRITIVAVGTRGDVQPVIALGLGLQAHGHKVTLVAGSNFADWITSYGLGHIPVTSIQELMQSDTALRWTSEGNKSVRQIHIMRDLFNQYSEQFFTQNLQAAEQTDLLITSFTSDPFIQAVNEKIGVPYMRVCLQPLVPTRCGPASFISVCPQRKHISNLISGWSLNFALWFAFDKALNVERTRIGLRPQNVVRYSRQIAQVPTLMGASPLVLPQPDDWPEHMQVVGYWFLHEGHGWQPTPELQAFLDAGDPPIYIGFGSMTQRDPQAMLDTILAALAKHKRRAVLAAGWSGVRHDALPDHVFGLDGAPHDGLFPHMAAVVHHGGAGTTAAGLYAGKPTLVVSHMGDQSYWGRRVHELGVGATPIRRDRLSADSLADGIERLLNDEALQQQAEALGERIRAEDGIQRAVAAIERWATA